MRIENARNNKPWRLWRATDLRSLMYVNVVFAQILGFLPYEFKPGGCVALSIARFIYSSITTLVYLFSLVLALYLINFCDTNDLSVPEALDTNSFFILDGFAIISIYFTAYKGLILYQKLFKLSQILSVQDFNRMSKFVHTKDAMVILYFLGCLPKSIAGVDLITASRLISLYTTISHFAMDMCYMNCVSVLGSCFEKVNENLKRLNEPTTDREPESSLVRTPLLRRQSLLMLMKLKYYEELHQEISDAVESVNDTFLVRIIIISITTFTVVTFNTYYSLLWIVSGFPAIPNRMFWFMPHWLVTIYYFSKFSLIIWACQSATNRAREIGTTVHVILNDSNDMIKRELRNFSLQMLHREIHFSARAITINAKLLTQMISGIMMYILILFQFLLNSISCRY
ncbi:uncharacterized protein LOC116432134 isoform X2 [Nomia melanderi]|uniref:uncharacterized protein LOC116432134 isoform X2 n=1 Tax=Nomia melanderi TaxID=2448451 RepID=UPI0013045BA9|nr:uncharacterized protein LOC116432134 isoform X2 [Nomia melanderi]